MMFDLIYNIHQNYHLRNFESLIEYMVEAQDILEQQNPSQSFEKKQKQ